MNSQSMLYRIDMTHSLLPYSPFMLTLHLKNVRKFKRLQWNESKKEELFQLGVEEKSNE